MSQELTTRQAEIKRLLDDGQGAKEIADQLGITRNAIYQQITAMKRKGLLSQEYTPTGEVRMPAPADGVRVHTPASGAGASMQVIAELVAMNKTLIALVERLTADQNR